MKSVSLQLCHVVPTEWTMREIIKWSMNYSSQCEIIWKWCIYWGKSCCMNSRTHYIWRLNHRFHNPPRLHTWGDHTTASYVLHCKKENHDLSVFGQVHTDQSGLFTIHLQLHVQVNFLSFPKSIKFIPTDATTSRTATLTLELQVANSPCSEN